MNASFWRRPARTAIPIVFPVTLILTSIFLLLVLAKVWVPIEYRMPGFPQDRFGFSLEDRVYWSSVDIDYLLGDEGLEYFDSYRLPDGSPMHNQRELRHMEDVKVLTGLALRVLIAGWVLLGLSGVVLWRVGAEEDLLKALMTGARWTIISMGLLVVGIVLAFGFLFVGFHRIFFEGTTWLFPTSDTFIRLYPERFWRDGFILFALVAVLLSTLVYFLAKRILARR